MRSGVLLDTGPLVAYLSARDRYHDWAVDTFIALELPAITCEPVLTEACFLIERNGQPAARVLDHAARSEIRIGLQIERELAAIRTLMERYASVPMSLADACLVRLAEIHRAADLHARQRFRDLSEASSSRPDIDHARPALTPRAIGRACIDRGRRVGSRYAAFSSSRRIVSPMTRVETRAVLGCRMSAVRTPAASARRTAASTRSASSARSNE